MSEAVQIAGPRGLVATTKVLLWIFLAVAAAGALYSLITGVIGLVHTLSTGLINLTLVAETKAAIFGGTDPRFATHIVAGHFSSADVTVAGLPAGIVATVVVSDVSKTLTEVALCVLVAVLAWRMLRRRPFRRSLSLTVSLAGLILVVGGVLGQGTAAIAGGATAAQLNGGGNGYWPLAGRFDPTLPVVGLVLVLVGLVFEYGTRLQNDTEGLV